MNEASKCDFSKGRPGALNTEDDKEIQFTEIGQVTKVNQKEKDGSPNPYMSVKFGNYDYRVLPENLTFVTKETQESINKAHGEQIRDDEGCMSAADSLQFVMGPGNIASALSAGGPNQESPKNSNKKQESVIFKEGDKVHWTNPRNAANAIGTVSIGQRDDKPGKTQVKVDGKGYWISTIRLIPVNNMGGETSNTTLVAESPAAEKSDTSREIKAPPVEENPPAANKNGSMEKTSADDPAGLNLVLAGPMRKSGPDNKGRQSQSYDYLRNPDFSPVTKETVISRAAEQVLDTGAGSNNTNTVRTADAIAAKDNEAAADDSVITDIRYVYTEADVTKAIDFEDYDDPTFQVMRYTTKCWTPMTASMFVKKSPANMRYHWDAMNKCSKAFDQNMRRAADPSIKAARYEGIKLPSGAVQTRQEKNRASKKPTQERDGAPWIHDTKQCTLNALLNAVTRRVNVQKAMATNETIGPFIDEIRTSFCGQNTDLNQLAYALVEKRKETGFNGFIRLHQLEQNSTDDIPMAHLPGMTASSSQKLIIFNVVLNNGFSHTQTIDTQDGYFGDPGYIHGAIKTDFSGAGEEWPTRVRSTLQAANNLQGGGTIEYPNSATHVWCVEYDLPASQKPRKRKRKDSSDDDSY